MILCAIFFHKNHVLSLQKGRIATSQFKRPEQEEGVALELHNQQCQRKNPRYLSQ